ncbi:uncharacterized protein LOC135821345 [Sycon ciliatum]|uniref:uncharacterized protein LOC135821345 n=1 Tax=Sycon ciliatum TaxID=27933 RepID=UPI0031F6BE96
MDRSSTGSDSSNRSASAMSNKGSLHERRTPRQTPSPLDRHQQQQQSSRRSPVIHFPAPPKDLPPSRLVQQGSSERDSNTPDSAARSSPGTTDRTASPAACTGGGGRRQRDSPLLNGRRVAGVGDNSRIVSRDSPDGSETMAKDSNGQLPRQHAASGGSSFSCGGLGVSRHNPQPVAGVVTDYNSSRAAAEHAGSRVNNESDQDSLDTPMLDVSADSLANMLSGFAAVLVERPTLPSSGAPTPDNAFESPESVASPPTSSTVSPDHVAMVTNEDNSGSGAATEIDKVLRRVAPSARCDSPLHANIQHVFPATKTPATTINVRTMKEERKDGATVATANTTTATTAASATSTATLPKQASINEKRLWEKVIVPHWALLLETIDVDNVCTQLLAASLLDNDQVMSLRTCSDEASAAARMVTYIGAHGDSAIITFSRIISEVAHAHPTYRNLVIRLKEALRRQLSSYYSDDGSSQSSVGGSGGGGAGTSGSGPTNGHSQRSSSTTPSPPKASNELAPTVQTPSSKQQISSSSTAGNLLAVPNIRLHLYDAYIDDDSVYDSSDFRTSCDISPLSSRRASLLDVVTYSPRATMERDKKPKPGATTNYTDVVLSKRKAQKAADKARSARNDSPLVVHREVADDDETALAAAAGADNAGALSDTTPPAVRQKKHRKVRSRSGLDAISSSSSTSVDDDSPRTKDLRRSSKKSQHTALRPTLSGQIEELNRLQDSLLSTVRKIKNDERYSLGEEEDEEEDEEGDDPAPAAICIARDSMLQTKYDVLTRSPIKGDNEGGLPEIPMFPPPPTGAPQHGHLKPPAQFGFPHGGNTARHGDGSSDEGESPERPITPPHSLIQPSSSFLAGDNDEGGNPSRALRRTKSAVYNLTPSFYDTTTTLSPTPGRMSSPVSPASPTESVECDSPMSSLPPLTSGVYRTHYELWMVTWIQEFLEVDSEYVDVFEMRLPDIGYNAIPEENAGKSILLHLLIEDINLAQFKCQREDMLTSIAEMLNVPIRTLRAMVRQVNEHAILLSLWLPLFCCTMATEMAAEKNRRLLSYGIAMVISSGRRVWCGQDRIGKASILSKLKQRLHSNDEKRLYETMEINVDRVAMELWNLVRPISNPVWHGALCGDVRILQMLTSVNAELELPDLEGNTPVHIAAQVGNVDALQYLLERGASANSRNKMHMTPLHWACNQGNTACVTELLKSGAKINAVELRHHATPLHVASMMGHAGVVEVLVANGADLGAVDKHQNTSLHLAILFAPVDPQEDIAKSELYADVVDMLLSAKAQASPCGVAWITPLHLACANGQEYLVEILLKFGANVNALDQELWQTPLHYAVMAEHSSVAELLVIAGANAAGRDKSGHSPLDLAETVTLSTMLETAERDSLLEAGGVVSPTSPTLCIVGDSGSGKSSLIQCVCSSVQRRQAFSSDRNSDSDASVTFETSTQRFNCFLVRMCDEIGVILRDVPASVQHHLPYCCYLGNKTSLFVVMLNATETYEEQIRSANVWLELIAFSSMAVAVRPSVMIVSTHAENPNPALSFVLSDRIIGTLADQYDGVLNISRRMHILNCRKPYSLAMSQFVDDVVVEASELIRTCHVPKLCNDVAQLLPELQCQYAVPIVEFDLFQRLVQQQLPDSNIDVPMLKHVTSYLHDLGQLVSVGTKEDGPTMIVLEPDWLCWDGFGRLMRPTSPEQDTVNPAITAAAGKVSQVGLQKLFSMVPCDAEVLVLLLRFCSMCLPILEHYQLTATMLGAETSRSIGLDGQQSARDRAWGNHVQFTRYAGRRWAMEGGQPFPLSVVSWLQVACGEHVSDDVLATMVTWRVGFKVAVESNVAEALVELTPDRRYLQLLVRCVKDARQQCAVLLQHITNMIVDTLGAELRGIETDISAISPRQLRSLAPPDNGHYDAVPFSTALSVYRTFLRGQSATAHSIAEQNAQPQRGRQMVASFINIGGRLEKLSDVLLLDEGDIRLIAQSVFGRELCERLLAHQYEELSGDSPDMGNLKPVSALDVEGMPDTLRQAASALRVPAMPLLWPWMAQPWLGMLRRWQGRRRSSWIRMQQALSALTENAGS